MPEQDLFLSVVVIILLGLLMPRWLVHQVVPLRLSNCAPNFYTLLPDSPEFILSGTKELPGGFHDSEFTFFGRALLSQLRVNVNEAIIRNLSLTIENITETAVKAIAGQQNFLDSQE